MKKISKNAFAIILSVILIFSFVPLTGAAFADEDAGAANPDDIGGYTDIAPGGASGGDSYTDIAPGGASGGDSYTGDDPTTPGEAGDPAGILPTDQTEGGEASGALPGDQGGVSDGSGVSGVEATEPEASGAGSPTTGLSETLDAPGLGEIEPDAESIPAGEPAADIEFSIVGASEYGNMLYLPQGAQVTDDALLAGVSAADENGDPVAVSVKDVDGLDMQNPQPRGPFPPAPYIITYEAIHPVSGEAFTATREAYVTVGIMMLAGVDPAWSGATPPTVSDGDIITISGAPLGTLNIPDGATVTVDGTVTGAAAGITLNIGAGATIIWNADFQGVAKSYFVTVTGSGTLDISSSSIVNIGAGGALDIEGAGTTVTLDGGANIYSGVGGNGILVSANDVTINVNPGSSVLSLEGNGNAAIQIGSGSNNNIQNTVINIDGGSVTSAGSGYAINDGAGAGNVPNNTMITIGSGSVTADTACAIHSTGTGSSVTVNGGSVSNAAGNNANPAIYMNAGSGDNVTVNGGTVQSTSAAGYAIQTTGNVSVTGGLITTVNGRCINLVGMDSLATVSGGIVQTTGNGYAISTATTDAVIPAVANASILVTGGTVSSANGFALNTTGAYSSVEISGGQIISASKTTGNSAVNASGAHASVTVTGGTVTATASHGINVTGANSSVTVSGGAVSSVTGNAINATAAASDAAITVDGTARVSSIGNHAIQTASAGAVITIDGSCQVWTMREGDAIHAVSGAVSGTVILKGGFVFAFSPYSLGVINCTHIVESPGSPALVVAWADGINTIYPEGNSTTTDEDLSNVLNGDQTNYWWHNDPVLGGGISYSYTNTDGVNIGFFPLSEVTVVADYGLIYDASTGYMHLNIDGTGVPGTGRGSTNRRIFPANYANGWVEDLSNPGTLTLNGFTWNTTAAVTLTIVGGDVTIVLADGSFNDFESFGPDVTDTSNPSSIYSYNGTFGIYSNGAVTIQGDGTLIATGGNTTEGDSVGIQADSFTLNGGSLVATGGDTSGAIDMASYGVNINDINDLTIAGGVFEAMGQSGALGGNLSALDNSRIKPPTAYTWWTNAAAEPPSPMGAGTVAFTGAPPYGAPLSYTAADQYVKIIEPPFAIIRDVTVSGTEGVTLAEQTATITLFGGEFDPLSIAAGDDISSWFADLPEGVVATAGQVSADGHSLTLIFSGTPTTPYSAVFDVTVPGDAIIGAGAAAYPVYPNPNARFDIAPVYDLVVVAESGGTVAGTLSGRYLEGSPVNTTATANPGYRFTGWTIGGAALRSADSNPALFNMPAGRVLLTATFEEISDQQNPPDDNNPGSNTGGSGSGGSGSSGSQSAQTGSGSPQTGDGGNPQGWALALLASFALIALCIFRLAPGIRPWHNGPSSPQCGLLRFRRGHIRG